MDKKNPRWFFVKGMNTCREILTTMVYAYNKKDAKRRANRRTGSKFIGKAYYATSTDVFDDLY